MANASPFPVSVEPDAGPVDQRALDDLKATIESLRAENAKLSGRERQIMELIGAASAERILHDIRNILNERELLRALTNIEE